MSPEKQRIAIAEACGWTDVKNEEWESVDIDAREVAFGVALQGTRNGERGFIPHYLDSLDAMHEVELSCIIGNGVEREFSHEREFQYRTALSRVMGHALALIHHATAAQRAEAFLRTIGKWEEVS